MNRISQVRRILYWALPSLTYKWAINQSAFSDARGKEAHLRAYE